MSHESRAGVKDGKDEDEDEDVGVSLKERQPGTEKRRHLGIEAIGDARRRYRLIRHGTIPPLNKIAFLCVAHYFKYTQFIPFNTFMTWTL